MDKLLLTAAYPSTVNPEDSSCDEENDVHITPLAVELHLRRYSSCVCIVTRGDSRKTEAGILPLGYACHCFTLTNLRCCYIVDSLSRVAETSPSSERPKNGQTERLNIHGRSFRSPSQIRIPLLVITSHEYIFLLSCLIISSMHLTTLRDKQALYLQKITGR
jgi:hypothetical protein